jgi:hypothetical protein
MVWRFCNAMGEPLYGFSFGCNGDRKRGIDERQ